MRMAVLILLLTGAAAPTLAAGVADPLGDIYPAFAANPLFAGGPVPGGFDVTSFTVTRDATNFTLSATLAGAPTAIGDGIFVIGVNRGAGTARFAPNVPNVLFDSVVVLDPNNGVTPPTLNANIIGGASTPLPVGNITLTANGFSVLVPLSALPSAGFAFDQYGFNLWPRLPGGPFSNISDFAPDNATITAVPEPAAWAAMLAGFAMAGAAVRRRRLVSA